jgi:hypothetical protein
MYHLPQDLEYQCEAGDSKQRICMSALYQRKKKAHPVWQDQNERITK